MNNLKYYVIAFFAIIIAISCSKEEKNNSDKGNLNIEFENGFDGLGGIVLNLTAQTSSNGQKHNFSALKYIVSNIMLTKDDGTEIKYNFNNPDKGAFIIDQAEAVGGICKIELSDIQSANYTKVKFGLGISPEAYLLGSTGQATFLTKAQNAGIFWGWASGYIFVRLDGLYGLADTKFSNHMGNLGDVSTSGNPNMYREISLNLPTKAKVRKNISPDVHIKVDWNKFLDGDNRITLSSSNDDEHGHTQSLIDVVNNLTKAFTVDHVHND